MGKLRSQRVEVRALRGAGHSEWRATLHCQRADVSRVESVDVLAKDISDKNKQCKQYANVPSQARSRLGSRVR